VEKWGEAVQQVAPASTEERGGEAPARAYSNRTTAARAYAGPRRSGNRGGLWRSRPLRRCRCPAHRSPSVCASSVGQFPFEGLGFPESGGRSAITRTDWGPAFPAEVADPGGIPRRRSPRGYGKPGKPSRPCAGLAGPADLDERSGPAKPGCATGNVGAAKREVPQASIRGGFSGARSACSLLEGLGRRGDYRRLAGNTAPTMSAGETSPAPAEPDGSTRRFAVAFARRAHALRLAIAGAQLAALAFAGTPALAAEEVTGFEVPFTFGGFNAHRGAAVDNSSSASKGGVYVADAEHHRVVKFSADGGGK
jgi:hypothetical protein